IADLRHAPYPDRERGLSDRSASMQDQRAASGPPSLLAPPKLSGRGAVPSARYNEWKRRHMSEAPADDNRDLQASFRRLRDELGAAIIGQPHLVECLLVALLADGHLLVEGAPGLAKTTAVKALAARIDAGFHRSQCTPDLLPEDLTVTDALPTDRGRFEFEPGPLSHRIVLADEVNRAPAKVQSALLEAMAERQVTIGRRSWPLPRLFMVMATQNPIEHEGTYTL